MQLTATQLQEKREQLYRLREAERLRQENRDLTQKDLEEKSLCEESLSYFIQRAWKYIDPAPYIHGWHVDAICDHLEAVGRGKIRRLLINQPPRTMKPVYEEEFVLEKFKGRIKLKEVQIGDFVLTHKGRYRKVLGVHAQGILPLLEIKSHTGRILKTTPDHLFLTAAGWKEAKNLKEHDALANVNPQEKSEAKKLAPELCRFLGYLIGDGSCKYNQIGFTNADEDVLLDFEKCAKFLGFFTRRRIKKGCSASFVILTPKEVKRKNKEENTIKTLLEKHGLWQKSSYDKNVPLAIFSSCDESIAQFVGAYWSCDGGVYKREKDRRDFTLAATSVNHNLHIGVQHLLLRLGINSRLRERKRPLATLRQGNENYKYTMLEIASFDEVAKFAQKIPLVHSKRKEIINNLEREKFDKVLFEDPFISSKESGFGECRCLEVEEDHSFVANDLAVHNSSLVSVAFVPWLWAQKQIGPLSGPQVSSLYASYAQTLSFRDSAKARRLIQSPWYQKLWGRNFSLSGDQNTKSRFDTNKGGYRIATSVGGALTGEGAQLICCDDAHNSIEAESDLVRHGVLDWWDQSLSTRLNDPKTGAYIVVMQRLNEMDLSGHILESANADWEHLMLPMRFEEDRKCVTSFFEDPRTNDGELLWPERLGEKEVSQLETVLGSFGSAGQLQQRPSPKGGGIIKRDDWQLWEPPATNEYPRMDFILASLDPAYTEKQENDWSGFSIIGVFQNENNLPRLMLMYAAHWRLGLNPLVNKMADLCREFKVDKLLIEAKASGISVGQEINRLYQGERWGVQMVDPKGDKVARAYSVQHLWEQGLIFAPDKEWAELAISELEALPKGRFDDVADSVLQSVIYLRNTGWALRNEEREAVIDEMLRPKGKPRPIYDV